MHTCVCVRIKKGAKADAAAKQAVKVTHRIFANAAGLSGTSPENFIPLNDFFQSTTAQAILLVEGAMSHLPDNASPWVNSPLRVAAEHNWLALRSAINRRQRALEHGEQMLVPTTVHLVSSLCPHFAKMSTISTFFSTMSTNGYPCVHNLTCTLRTLRGVILQHEFNCYPGNDQPPRRHERGQLCLLLEPFTHRVHRYFEENCPGP